MLPTCPLFCLTIFCTGVSLGIILEPETKTLTVPLGGPATFRCNVTGGDLGSYQMSWYKKNEDQSLTSVYRQGNNATEGARSKFKGKVDALKSQYILDIQNATAEDVGTYYCGSDIHSAPALLLVASKPPAANRSGTSNERPSRATVTTKLSFYYKLVATRCLGSSAPFIFPFQNPDEKITRYLGHTVLMTKEEQENCWQKLKMLLRASAQTQHTSCPPTLIGQSPSMATPRISWAGTMPLPQKALQDTKHPARIDNPLI